MPQRIRIAPVATRTDFSNSSTDREQSTPVPLLSSSPFPESVRFWRSPALHLTWFADLSAPKTFRSPSGSNSRPGKLLSRPGCGNLVKVGSVYARIESIKPLSRLPLLRWFVTKTHGRVDGRTFSSTLVRASAFSGGSVHDALAGDARHVSSFFGDVALRGYSPRPRQQLSLLMGDFHHLYCSSASRLFLFFFFFCFCFFFFFLFFSPFFRGHGTNLPQ